MNPLNCFLNIFKMYFYIFLLTLVKLTYDRSNLPEHVIFIKYSLIKLITVPLLYQTMKD